MYPFFELGSRVLPTSTLLPQAFTNEIVVWAVLNALVVWILGRLFGRVGPQRRVSRSRALALSMLAFAAAYSVMLVVNAALQTDLRFWFFALKPMSMRQFGMFLIYLVPFSFYRDQLRSADGDCGFFARSLLRSAATPLQSATSGPKLARRCVRAPPVRNPKRSRNSGRRRGPARPV